MTPLAEMKANTQEIDPRVTELHETKLKNRLLGPYAPLADDSVSDRLRRLISVTEGQEFRIESLARMSGGASKEQYSFELETSARGREKLVLRLDPRESIVETCRYREKEVFDTLRGVVPLPEARFIDGDGSILGQPGIVTSFVEGVARPPQDGGQGVSGLGTEFSPEWRDRLSGQFIGNLVKIHDFRWQEATLDHFAVPDEYPEQAAEWQVNWWSKLWREDRVEDAPLMAVAEEWLRERLPKARDLVLLHGDYRTGNFLFDADSGDFTAILDWELAHIGDHHEDLAWGLQRLFSARDESGVVRVCNLLTRDEYIEQYATVSGRDVDPATLHFYEVLTAYKLTVINLATGYGVASRGTNHQDVLLAWLTQVGPTLLSEIARLLNEDPA